MLLYLRLFYEFAKTGLFAIGGGLATLPFLYEMSAKTGWFTTHDISNMIAVSESTPGPIGINMSTYVGFQTSYTYFGVAGGVLGGIVATLSLVLPSIIVIELVSTALNRFKESRIVQEIFYGLRPASTGLVASSGMGIAKVAFLMENTTVPVAGLVLPAVNIKSLILGVLIFVSYKKFKLHPVVYIAAAAVIGIIFKF